MSSVLEVRFEASRYHDLRKISFTKKIKSDLCFEDEQHPAFEIDGKVILPPHTKKANSIADQWLETQSEVLTDIIHDPKRELHCIMDFKVLSITNTYEDGTIKCTRYDGKKVKVKVEDTILAITAPDNNRSPLPENLRSDFVAAYIKMKDSLKGLSIEKQIEIVLSSMSLGYTAATEAYRSMSQILTGEVKQIADTADKINLTTADN